jgi:WbqC-like protein
MQQVPVFSIAYLPPVAWFQKIKQDTCVYIEQHEHYTKQSYRNRCNVLGANGVLSLSIPVVATHDKQLISDVKISYDEKWQQQHWRTIESAYRNTPYFIYYADALKSFYQKKYDFLFEYNIELIQLLMKNFKLNTDIKFTETYDTLDYANDYRNSIHPKKEIAETAFKPYPQLFNEGQPFKANLSSIDLLFNTGPNAKEYL